MPDRTQPAGTSRRSSVLRWTLRFDRAGSAWFIGGALCVAPALVVLPGGAYRWAVWTLVAVGSIWLAALGIAMAAGLVRAVVRGDELPDEWWNTMLGVPASPPTDHESRVRNPVRR